MLMLGFLSCLRLIGTCDIVMSINNQSGDNRRKIQKTVPKPLIAGGDGAQNNLFWSITSISNDRGGDRLTPKPQHRSLSTRAHVVQIIFASCEVVGRYASMCRAWLAMAPTREWRRGHYPVTSGGQGAGTRNDECDRGPARPYSACPGRVWHHVVTIEKQKQRKHFRKHQSFLLSHPSNLRSRFIAREMFSKLLDLYSIDFDTLKLNSKLRVLSHSPSNKEAHVQL